MKSFCKINLFLHVLGKQPDGYHQLESLFYFPSIADDIEITPAHESLFIAGRFAGSLQGDVESNLIFKAYKLLQNLFPKKIPELSFLLVKNLPVSAGIGGGSGNAATVLRELNSRYNLGLSLRELYKIGLTLGADVPVCILSESCFAQGIGEIITEVELPKLHILLVNPLITVSTAEIFKNGFQNYSAPITTDLHFQKTQTLIDFLEVTRNDLEPAAKKLCPEIDDIINTISTQPGNLIARMSGSGATCFGIFESRDKALLAKEKIIAEKPNWWVEAG